MATPIGTTTNYGLNKWADGANPGGTALNATLDAIDTQMKVNADAASETTLTKIIYSVTYGSAGKLNVRELFNNSGLTLAGSVTPDAGTADWYFAYNPGDIGAGKSFLFTPQTIFMRTNSGTDTAVIKGYAFMDNSLDFTTGFYIRTVGADFEEADIIAADDHLIWEIIIVDA